MEIKPYIPYIKNKSVLDLGCGEGYWSNEMAKYASTVEGIDLNINSIKIASKFKHKPNLSFRVSSATSIQVPNNSFGFVWCSEVLEHINGDFKAINEIKRVLKKGGMAFITTPCSEGLIKYNYPLSKTLKIFIPKFLRPYFGSLIEGDIYLWTKRADHVRLGYSKKDFEKIAKEKDFEILKITYRTRSELSKRIFEFTYCLPNIIAIVLVQLIVITNTLIRTNEQRKKDNNLGLGIEVLMKKN